MGLDDVVRRNVAVADRLTTTLQSTVTHYAFSSETDEGVRAYDPTTGTKRLAVVRFQQRKFRTVAGEEVVSRAKVLFVRPLTIDARDKIVLPDGTTGPILDMQGTVDPETGEPYATTIWLG